jgi:hypothetical protein
LARSKNPSWLIVIILNTQSYVQEMLADLG